MFADRDKKKKGLVGERKIVYFFIIVATGIVILKVIFGFGDKKPDVIFVVDFRRVRDVAKSIDAKLIMSGKIKSKKSDMGGNMEYKEDESKKVGKMANAEERIIPAGIEALKILQEFCASGKFNFSNEIWNIGEENIINNNRRKEKSKSGKGKKICISRGAFIFVPPEIAGIPVKDITDEVIHILRQKYEF